MISQGCIVHSGLTGENSIFFPVFCSSFRSLNHSHEFCSCCSLLVDFAKLSLQFILKVVPTAPGYILSSLDVLAHSTSIRMPWRQDSRPRGKPSRLGAKASEYLWNAQVWGSLFQCVASQKAKSVDNFVVVVLEFPSYSLEVDRQLGQPASELVSFAMKCAGFLDFRLLRVSRSSG